MDSALAMWTFAGWSAAEAAKASRQVIGIAICDNNKGKQASKSKSAVIDDLAGFAACGHDPSQQPTFALLLL